jgi:uncharacterized protein (DUF1810 family)
MESRLRRDDRSAPFNLDRFRRAQEPVYAEILRELASGRKRTHWMWFIFPQIAGLGFSETSKYYAIKSRDEARQFLRDPVLGQRLIECSQILLAVQCATVLDIFGSPDDQKLQSSMTLFELVSNPGSIFGKVLDKYFGGHRDAKTIGLIDRQFA